MIVKKALSLVIATILIIAIIGCQNSQNKKE